jgi:hypothetical protein
LAGEYLRKVQPMETIVNEVRYGRVWWPLHIIGFGVFI